MSLDVTLFQDGEEVFSSNITSNLIVMAREAEISQHLWDPKGLGIIKAGELIEPLSIAQLDLVKRPDHYEQFDASNGWGTYKHFIPWVQEYLQACVKYPEATIEVSR